MVDKLKEAALKKFELYAKGVERLKELEKELNSISTKKYKKQELKIRKKLKNVSLIPEIEEDIRKLRLKIAGIDQEDLDSKVNQKQQLAINNIAGEEKEIESNVSSLHNKINSLELELKKAENIRGKTVLDKHEKKLLSQIPINRKRITFLKNLLEIRAQQLEEEINKKKLFNQSGFVNQIKQLDASTQKQSNNLNFLKQEAEELQLIMPAVIQRISFVEQELNHAEKLTRKKELTKNERENIQLLPNLKNNLFNLKNEVGFIEDLLAKIEMNQLSENERRDVDKISDLKNRIDRMALELERPSFYTKRKFFEKKVEAQFQTYGQGIKRLKELENELNLMNVHGYEKYAEDIRRKLKEVSLIPQIEEDLRNLKLRIAGVDVDYRKSIIDSKQDRKLSELGKNEKILESQIAQELGIIPQIQRKTNFISRLFKKESLELAELENRVDKDKLEMNDRLLNELAESKRLIQEEKLELKKHLLDLLDKSLKEVNKQKEESDKKLLEQIEKLNQKIELDKKNMDQEVLSQIIELREKLNKDKHDVERNNKQIGDIKNKLEKFSAPSENQIPDLVFKKITIPEQKLSKQEIAKQEKMTAAIQDSFSLPKPIAIPDLDFSNAPDLPKFEESIRFAMPETKIKSGKIKKIMPLEVKPEKPRKLKIPKKRFMHSEDYEVISREFKQLKYLAARDYAYLSKNFSSKATVDNELLKMNEKFDKIKQNFSKIKPTFSFKSS
jgi:hypothetical protein